MPKFTGYMCDESGKQIIPGKTAYAIVTMEFFAADGKRAEVQRRYVHESAYDKLQPGEKVNVRVRKPKEGDATAAAK